VKRPGSFFDLQHRRAPPRQQRKDEAVCSPKISRSRQAASRRAAKRPKPTGATEVQHGADLLLRALEANMRRASEPELLERLRVAIARLREAVSP
jgi:hypothetical protein